MKFLIDVGVGKGVEEYLRGKGFDVKAVREIDPRMEDERIILEAFQERRIVVTMDKDFGELVFQSSMRHSGILLLRMEDASGPEKVSVVRNIIENFQEHIADSFCVYKKQQAPHPQADRLLILPQASPPLSRIAEKMNPPQEKGLAWPGRPGFQSPSRRRIAHQAVSTTSVPCRDNV